MRRPLFAVCLCLVVLAGWLFTDTVPPDIVPDIGDGTSCIVTGRVYKKDNEYFYLNSIFLEQESANQQKNSLDEKSLYENAVPESSVHESSVHESSVYESSVHESSVHESSVYESSAYKNPVYENLMCEYDGETEILIGSTVRVSGVFDSFSAATNPGEFDTEEYYHSLEIGGKLRKVTVLGTSEEYSELQESLFRIRKYFRERLYAVFPEKEASVMSAMLLGDKTELDEEVKALYQSNGIVHILSISGLHITIIGMSIYRMLRKCGVPIYPAAICAGVILLLYGVMTGMSVSACRAIGMYLFRMLAELVGRTYDMLTALGVMAAIMVWSNPGYLQNAGFYLSFGAVMGIGIVYPALLPPERKKTAVLRYEECGWKQKGREWVKKWEEGLKQSIVSGASVTLITLPIQLWFYYEVPTYSVLINLFVLPFMSMVMICGMLAMLVPGLGILGTVDYLVLNGYELLCRGFEKLPFHTWNPGRPKVWQMVVYYLLLFGVVAATTAWRSVVHGERALWNNSKIAYKINRFSGRRLTGKSKVVIGKKLIRGRYLVFGQVLMLTTAVMVLGIGFPDGKTAITFLDVGQGDCICIQTASGEVYLFDCGSTSRSEVGEYVLKPFLKYRGISRIDAVFVSHSDSDHCNGVEELQTYGEEWGITVDQWIMPGDIYAGASWQSDVSDFGQSDVSDFGQSDAGSSLRNDEIRFICLNPPRNSGLGSNPESEWGSNPESEWGNNPESEWGNNPESNPEDTNESSQCFYVEMGKFSLLLTGDVEGEGEEYLLSELKTRGIDTVTILKVAHHGSRYSTSEAFLNVVQPKVAVISCGKDNSYGHPHEETIERLENVGATILTTPECGAIMVEVGEKMEVRSWINPTE